MLRINSMTPTTKKLDHISHEHPLILINDFDASSIAAQLVCRVCEIPIIGFCHAYTCCQEDRPCSFFLHKRCAESPKHIKHPIHPQHQLVLGTNYNHEVRPYNTSMLPLQTYISCAGCTSEINLSMWVYSCEICHFVIKLPYNHVTGHRFALCVRCAIAEPVLGHKGHQQHPLTLLCRRAYFRCDACGLEAWDNFSYTCLACQYLIHGSCAAFPATIKLRIHEDDTLQLIYSIPEMYRRFIRHCPICRWGVSIENWAYFCEKSGYFVHIKCAAALLASGKNVIEIENDDGNTYPDLMHFPLPSIDPLVANLIAEQQSAGEQTDTNTIKDKVENEKEDAVIHHWSHREHPLILLEELWTDNNNSDDDNDEIDTNNRIDEMLVCNGCMHPISTAFNRHYYGCIGCNFFLHTSCANHLPLQSPPGKCGRHPEHKLKLCQYNQIGYCIACWTRTDGFVYECEECLPKLQIDICCFLAPHRIKHKYHKHPLVQRSPTSKKCNACLSSICIGFEYGCETCSDIQIHPNCALSFPGMISHRWDSHSISLIYPPIYYKGLRYCELCELEINQEAWLYRCGECDRCFHPFCIRQPHNVKVGVTTLASSHNLHSHTLTLKMIDKDRYPERIHKYLSCSNNRDGIPHFSLDQDFYLECAGCNYLLCLVCARLPTVRQSPLLLNQVASIDD